MPMYNKLIRDRIVEILENEGLNYNVRVLEEDEYLSEIKKKLHEEVKEFEQTTNKIEALEELSDILELTYAALAAQEQSFEELESFRLEKRRERGSFEKRLFLIEVENR